MIPDEIYHYTSPQHSELILRSKKIKLGSILNENGVIVHNFAISLTTELDPDGHGLPDGRVITVALSKTMGHLVEKDGTLRSFNKKKVRIKISTTNLQLTKCINYYSHNENILTGLAIGGYYPYNDSGNATKEELLAYLSKSKAKTWYYCFHEIPDTEILEIKYL